MRVPALLIEDNLALCGDSEDNLNVMMEGLVEVLSNLLYADDLVLYGDSEEGFRSTVGRFFMLKKVSRGECR